WALTWASLPGFGCDDFPVRIARGNVACERPHVGDVGNLFGVTVDHVPRSIAGRGNELGHEADGDLGGAAAQFSAGDGRAVDRNEARLRGLAAAFTFADRGVKAVRDLARQQAAQLAAIAF